MKKSRLHISVPLELGGIRFADLPLSIELSAMLERLQVVRLEDLLRLTVSDLPRSRVAAKALVLELGVLVRRARSGEFGQPAREPAAAWRSAAQWPVQPASVPGERIEIPASAATLPLGLIQMPARLRGVMDALDFKLAGELHGRMYRDCLRLANVGAKTLEDLRSLVEQIREGRVTLVPPRAEEKVRIPLSFVVPEAVRGIVPYDLPISTRLDGVFRRMGITRLGDLHGMEFVEMLKCAGCGRKTLNEAIECVGRAPAGTAEL